MFVNAQWSRPIILNSVAQPMEGPDTGITTPGKSEFAGTTGADQLIVYEVWCHPDKMQISPLLAQDLVPGGKRNQMRKAFQRDALAVPDMRGYDFFQAAELHYLLHYRLRLFALVLRQVIERPNSLASRTGAFPAPERLV